MSTRTQVGITEWARRIERARVTEMWLADTLGAEVPKAPDAVAKIALVREGRLHAWHAELWMKVVPVLHDISVDAVEAGAERGSEGATTASVIERLDNDYRAWQADASPIAEAPILRVLLLAMRDHEDEGLR